MPSYSVTSAVNASPDIRLLSTGHGRVDGVSNVLWSIRDYTVTNTHFCALYIFVFVFLCLRTVCLCMYEVPHTQSRIFGATSVITYMGHCTNGLPREIKTTPKPADNTTVANARKSVPGQFAKPSATLVGGFTRIYSDGRREKKNQFG